MFGKDKFKVTCSTCDEIIGEVTYEPGKKYLGCGKCHTRTLVEISHDGEVHTKKYEHAVNWQKKNDIRIKKAERKE